MINSPPSETFVFFWQIGISTELKKKIQGKRKLATSQYGIQVFACNGVWKNYYYNFYRKTIGIVGPTIYNVIYLIHGLQQKQTP